MQHSQQLPECRKDIDHLREMINSKLDVLIIEMSYVKEQTTKTNGRVTKIEENGALFFWIGKNWKPVITVIIAVVGMFTIEIIRR